MKCKISDKKILTIILVIFGILVLIPVIYFLVLPFFEKEKPSPIPTKEVGQEEIPTSQNFDEVILQLNTSQKLVDYLNENFKFRPKEGNVALDPKEFFEKKEGGEQDFAAFSAYTLYQNGFISFIFAYQYLDSEQREKTHFVTSFRDTDVPKYIYFDEQGAHLIAYGWSYEELCQKEEERLGIKILRYGVIPPRATELVCKEWIERK